MLRKKSRRGVVTLLYGARDTENNQAAVLRSILKEQALTRRSLEDGYGE